MSEETTAENIEDYALDEIRDFLENNLPPLIAREDVKRLTGLYSKNTLANADCQGTGPKNPMLLEGRTVAYTRPALIEWIIAKIKMKRTREHLD